MNDLTFDVSTVSRTIRSLLEADAWKAITYTSPTAVIRVTRRWYVAGNKPDKRRIEVLVSVGPPNYRERQFVKACKKAGEPFPIKKIQLKFRVKRKKK